MDLKLLTYWAGSVAQRLILLEKQVCWPSYPSFNRKVTLLLGLPENRLRISIQRFSRRDQRVICRLQQSRADPDVSEPPRHDVLIGFVF